PRYAAVSSDQSRSGHATNGLTAELALPPGQAACAINSTQAAFDGFAYLGGGDDQELIVFLQPARLLRGEPGSVAHDETDRLTGRGPQLGAIDAVQLRPGLDAHLQPLRAEFVQLRVVVCDLVPVRML